LWSPVPDGISCALERSDMKDAYEVIKDRWLADKPLKVEEFTLEQLESAISQGCSDRNYSPYMHYIAKRVEQLKKDKT